MKLKAAIRYQTIEFVQCAAVFCLIIGVIFVLLGLYPVSQGAHMGVSGMATLPFVFMPFLALSVFSGDVRFLLQMGLTRNQAFASTAASFAVACLFLALVETACAIFVPFWSREQSLFLMAYGPENGPALDFFFMLLSCAAVSAVGLALAAVQMRVGTKRLLLGVGVIYLAVIALPAFVPLADGVSWLFGFGEGASLANPFILFVAVTALGALVAWAAVRRLEVR